MASEKRKASLGQLRTWSCGACFFRVHILQEGDREVPRYEEKSSQYYIEINGMTGVGKEVASWVGTSVVDGRDDS